MAYLIVNRAYYELPGNMATSLDEARQKAREYTRLDNFITVVPTGRRARYLQRKFTREIYALHSLPASSPLICNLEQLALRIFYMMPQAEKSQIISDAYRLALFEEAAETAELRFFRRKQDRLSPVALQRLASVIFGLKEDGITPENLLADVERANATADSYGIMASGEEIDTAKLADLAQLYAEYERLLDNNLLDKPASLHIVTQALKADRISPQSKFFHAETSVFLDGFTEFKLPEVEFIVALSELNVPLALRLDYSTDNGPLFGNLADTLERFAKSGLYIKKLDEIPAFNDEVPADMRTFLPLAAYLRRWLFNSERQIFHHGFSRFVSILAAGDRTDEVISIAKLVRHLAIERNIPLAEMCIATRQIELYSNLIREIFGEHNIQTNVTDRFPLAKSPVTTALFAVLDMVLNGFRRQDVHRALQNPYLRFKNSDAGEFIDGVNLYATAERLRIIGGARRGGRNHWKQTFLRETERAGKRLERLRTDIFSDPLDIIRAERELGSSQRAVNDFDALCESMPEPNTSAAPSEIAALIKHFIIEKFHIRDSITDFFAHAQARNFASKTERDQVFSEVEKDARALGVLLELLDEIAGVQERRFGRRKLSLQQFADKFRIAVDASKYQTREKSGYGITVTTLEQTRGIPYRIVICCGLNDGEFPSIYIPDSFIGKELPDTEDRFIRAERMQFYQILAGVLEQEEDHERHIFLTYCSRNGDEQSVRSPFIDALLKISTLGDDNRVFNLCKLAADRIAETDMLQWSECSWREAVTSTADLLKYADYSEAQAIYPSAHILETTKYIKFYLENRINTPQRFTGELPEDFFVEIKRNLERPFSISELETYAACPYKYFAERVLRLNERKKSDSALTSVERGSLLHLIMYRFYRKIQEEMLASGETGRIVSDTSEALPPAAPVKLRPERKQYYRDVLHQIAREEFAAIGFDHPFFELEKRDLLGTEKQNGDLTRRLDADINSGMASAEFYPSLFEIGFGMKSAGGGMLPAIDIGGLLLRGKIDRLEIGGTGANKDFIVVDYKSGSSVKTNADIKKGQSFQMPLYLIASQKIMESYYGVAANPVAAAYYLLRPVFDVQKGKAVAENFVLLPKNSQIAEKNNLTRTPSKQIVADENERDNMIEFAAEKARRNVAAIAVGIFTVQPFNRKSTCQYCSFISVCRINESE
ncbi:hypothetical protein MASR2M18_21580 [Ignavibacteria bacterium]|nr:exodeoxyribonuclease V subunit gamma [Bacteroidota bacterium]MCZ2133296.1 exodeoxyribonuclease V subunit gamma [Bacteroidota bacterium]